MLHVGCGSVGLIFVCATSAATTDAARTSPIAIVFFISTSEKRCRAVNRRAGDCRAVYPLTGNGHWPYDHRHHTPGGLMTIRHFVWAVVLALTSASGAMAQTRATAADLTGTVLDQTNSLLPGATVTATNTETNAVRVATTDARGRYTIPALPPG